jgi:hypothetical protein
MSVISHIIEPTNFTQSRCDFNIPKLLCNKMRLCHLGVYGIAGQPADPLLGQLAIIDKITLRDGGVILSSYNRNIKSYMKLKLLASSTNDDFRAKRRNLDASLTGFELRRGGSSVNNVAGAGLTTENSTGMKVCVDKRDPPQIKPAENSSRFAMLDLADVLGWCSAVYSSKSAELSNIMPCHIHNQLKLSIEFAPVASVLAGSTIAQPYLIFHEVQNPEAEKAFMNPDIVAQFSDWESENVFLNNAQTSKVFLNSFFNKTVSKLAMINDMTAGSGASSAQPGEVFRLLVNNTPYFQLTTGLNTPAKKAAFTRMAGYELPIPIHSDKIEGVATCWPANPDATTVSICDGTNAADVSGSLFYRGANSYMVLDLSTKINNLQIDYSIGAAPAGALTLQFWGQVEKLVSYNSSAPVVAYV